MGNARKHLFWNELFPNINCSLCRMIQPNTWLHILLCCTEPHIHKLCIKRHNKVVHEIRKLLISNTKSRCFILVNAGKTVGQPQENTVPNGYFHVVVMTKHKDANATLNSDQTYYASATIHTMQNHHKNPTTHLQYNS
jgi:DNA/RNA endonuclease G (NUC1)